MSDTKITKSRASVYTRKYRYGITEEQYDDLIAEQGNACAVCKTKFTETVRPNIDHDHNCCKGSRSCGRCIRGLLCSNCLTLASLVETRFGYMNELFTYLHHHLVSERRK